LALDADQLLLHLVVHLRLLLHVVLVELQLGCLHLVLVVGGEGVIQVFLKMFWRAALPAFCFMSA
jgi:hypothetical protein